MTQIKNIVFDFGGVLVDWNPRYLYDKYFGDEVQSQWFLDNICLYSWNLQMDGGKPFAEGVAAVQGASGKWGYIDTNGEWVVNPQFDWANDFSDGLALVELNGKYGYIDKTGAFVIVFVRYFIFFTKKAYFIRRPAEIIF